jgi:hypothetical protein
MLFQGVRGELILQKTAYFFANNVIGIITAKTDTLQELVRKRKDEKVRDAEDSWYEGSV